MYKHLEKADFQRMLSADADYKIDGLIVIGSHPKAREYPFLYEALKKIGLEYHEEKIEAPFFSEVKSLVINNKRIWFDIVYGASYLSELLHVASILGSQANILLGSCGALQENLGSGDTILPSMSYGNESTTRMYQRDNLDYHYPSDENLRSKIKSFIGQRDIVNEGKMMTVQAMLAESKEDVDNWSKGGYVAVDEESSTVFAVSNHFSVPSAALLYVADNLIRNELVSDVSYESLREKRMAIKAENYEVAIRTILGV